MYKFKTPPSRRYHHVTGYQFQSPSLNSYYIMIVHITTKNKSSGITFKSFLYLKTFSKNYKNI